MRTLRQAIRPVLGLGLAAMVLGFAPSSASAQLFGRRTVVVQQPAYIVSTPGTVVTTATPVAYTPTVYSSGVVPAAYSPTIVTSGPVPTTYTTTSTYVPTAVYSAPVVVTRGRMLPRRAVYRYYYPY